MISRQSPVLTRAHPRRGARRAAQAPWAFIRPVAIVIHEADAVARA